MSFNINQRLNGLNPLAYSGVNAVEPPNFVSRPAPPNSGDSKNFQIGTIWLDTSGYPNTLPTAENIWVLVALVGNVATWVALAGTSALESLTGNDGLVVVGDANDNINVLTANSTPQFKRTGANTLTVDFGLNNLALGSSLPALTTGGFNAFYGFEAGKAITSANFCTFVGYDAGTSTTSGSANLFIGWRAGQLNTTGLSNVGVGNNSLRQYTTNTVCANAGFGHDTLGNLLTGQYCTAVGNGAGGSYSAAESSNISVGYLTGGTPGESNVLRIGNGSGVGAGQLSKAFIQGISGVTPGGAGIVPVVIDTSGQLGTGGATVATSFDTNPATGTAAPAAGVLTFAGGSNITATAGASTVTFDLDNTVSVSGSVTGGTGLSATTGDVAVVAGNLTLPNTNVGGTEGEITVGGTVYYNNFGSGGSNLFWGANAGRLNAGNTGGANSGFGGSVFGAVTSATSSSAFGYQALAALTSGSNVTALGSAAAQNLTTGGNSVFVGYQSGGAVSTGSGNLALGYQAGNSWTAADANNIAIGNVGAAESATIRIGTAGTHTKAFLAGVRGVTTGINDAVPVLVDSAGQLGVTSSSIRYKENVQDMGDKSNVLYKLRPVTFRYKNHPPQSKSVGLIAEEVEQVCPDLVVHSLGQIDTVKYQDLIPMLLNEIQALNARIIALENK